MDARFGIGNFNDTPPLFVDMGDAETFVYAWDLIERMDLSTAGKLFDAYNII